MILLLHSITNVLYIYLDYLCPSCVANRKYRADSYHTNHRMAMNAVGRQRGAERRRLYGIRPYTSGGRYRS
jgi:hypothetical protein